MLQAEENQVAIPTNSTPAYYEPNEVLTMGQRMAGALKKVLTQNNWTIKIGPSEHLRFEAWQTLGSFFGYVPSVLSVQEIKEGNKILGYLCHAGVKRLKDGVIVSEAEATCMRDEPNWKNKPLFQLRSMAQTRACAKALRLCFSWIVALAGYDPTPAEEIDATNNISQPQRQEPNKNKQEPLKEDDNMATAPQLRLMSVLFNKLGITEKEDRLDNVTSIIGRKINSSKELTKEEASKVIEALQKVVDSTETEGGF